MKLLFQTDLMKILQSLLFFLSLLLCSSAFAIVPTQVMITVDVESYGKGNPGLQIWGNQPDGGHGIQRMMDMLDAHGLKGTFYLNVYEAAKFGEAELANVARTINSRGHDLQLHTHPGPMFGIETMQQASLEKQVEILNRGKELIQKWTGKTVVAHRAGGYYANLNTLKACKITGIPLENSFSPVSSDTMLAKLLPASNLPRKIEGVVEIPITYYDQIRVGDLQSMRYLDIEGSSYDEMVSAIRQFRDAGLPVVTIMMHSFSFVRSGKTDPAIEKRFDNVLKFLATEPGIKVVTVSQLYPEWAAHVLSSEQGVNFIADTGVWLMYRRAWEDHDTWKNIVVAATPPAILFAIGAITIWWRRNKRKGLPTL